MSYDLTTSTILQEEGVELSTMMKSPCLRYKGTFLAMMFEREDCLIIKVSPERVNELIKALRQRYGTYVSFSVTHITAIYRNRISDVRYILKTL